MNERVQIKRSMASTLTLAPGSIMALPAGVSTPILASPSLYLFVLFVLQCLLFGESDELGAGKLIYAGLQIVVMLFCVPLLPNVFLRNRPDPLVLWTTALMALCCFSRFAGMLWNVGSLDWMRDFVVLLNLSWIIIGPAAFRSLREIRLAYWFLVSLVAVLSVNITGAYLVLRGFVPESVEWQTYFRSTDVVVLVGIFLCLPMATIRPKYAYAGTLFFLVLTLMTGTRSHLGAIMAGVTFYAWLTRRDRTKNVLLPAFALAILAVGIFVSLIFFGLIDPAVVLARFVNAEGGVRGPEERWDETLNAFNIFLKSPLVGVGLGYMMPPIYVASTLTDEPPLYLVHNFYAYVLAKFGLLGVSVFGGFLLAAVRTPMRLYRTISSPFEKAFCAGVASLVIALLVESLAAPRFTDKTSNMILAICLCMVLSLQRMFIRSGEVDE